MEFKLTITMGNDAVRTGQDLHDILEDIATDIYQHQNHLLDYPLTKNVRDYNGNRVGTWEIVD